mgnify:CR=1 FL=1
MIQAPRHPARVWPFEMLEQRLLDSAAEGLVSVQREGPLALFCYSKEAVYSREWTPAVRLARGLVLDLDARRVVATPWPKFWNLGESPTPGEPAPTLPAEPFEVFDKLDGSLIVIWHWGGRWRCSTKGSFNSPQAHWAAARIAELDRQQLECLTPGATYLCEAIYAENRIVIHYPEDRLHLLAAYHEDGREFSYAELFAVAAGLRHSWPLVARLQEPSIAALLAQVPELPADREGFVLRFESGLRLKIKGEAYLRIHRAVSRLTPLAVWEHLAAGNLAESLRRELPEEFWLDFDRIHMLLLEEFSNHHRLLQVLVEHTTKLEDKALGLALQSGKFRGEPLAKLLFTARKQPERVEARLWELIRPTGNQLEGYRPGSAITRVQQEVG